VAEQDEVVRAAGGVLWRRDHDGAVEVLLVHRPRYDDWSLPKGKLLAGETEPDAARREVAEETGLVCELGPELATASYRDSKGRPKTARYWAMRPVADEGFTPNDEVDQLRWLSLERAGQALSYRHDRAVLDGLAPTLA
jgi:8-oxo-dGTP pyrophosphatase MutT (NUDIX family)